MLVGIDGRKVPGATGLGPLQKLDVISGLGLDGVLFRTVFDMDPDLDPDRLRRIRDRADELGLYLETGLGNVNPYAMAEHPHLRRTGDGDTMLGLTRAVTAAAALGCRELWAVTGGFKPYPGRFAYDRFRTDVTWSAQLAATTRLLERLAPVCRDLGVHLNLETHEEITSFELVRIVESVGPDVLGLTYDTTNPIQRGENPLDTARRIAPYVRQTHVKDVVLSLTPQGLQYQQVPVGQGVVDVPAILDEVRAAGSRPRLSLEAMTSARDSGAHEGQPHPHLQPILVDVFDATWHAEHRDLTAAELSRTLQLGLLGNARVADGTARPLAQVAAAPFGAAEAEEFVRASAGFLRALDRAGAA